jgi:hypothetical protein
MSLRLQDKIFLGESQVVIQSVYIMINFNIN